MNITRLSWKNMVSKPGATSLSLLLLTMGVGIVSLLMLLGNQLQEQFERNIRGVDMVVGAKGSPLQLILSAMLHIDNPTGNIPLVEVEKLKKNRLVGKVIPLAYGDSYQGFRIVGTDTAYINLYNGEMASGSLWSEVMEVIVGVGVADRLGLKTGDEFESAHGLEMEGEIHAHKPFRVVGILKPTGSILDQLVLTAVESVWEVHTYEGDDAGEALPRELTAALVKFRSPMGVISVPRMINTQTSMQAAIPSYEISKLVSLLGIGIDTITLLGLVIMAVSGISLFINLYTSLETRKYEMALMRSYGASRRQLLWMVLQESLILCVIGFVLGIAISRIGLATLSGLAEEQYHYEFFQASLLTPEYWLFAGVMALGVIASLIPAFRVYRVSISETLSD